MIGNGRRPGSVLFASVHITRTAGCSLAELLKAAGGTKKFKNPFTISRFSQHLNAAEYNTLLGKSRKRHYMFSFVRNPWDRAVSTYLAFVFRSGKYGLHSYGDTDVLRDEFERWVKLTFVDDLYPYEVSWKRKAPPIPEWLIRRMMVPQYDWLYEDDRLLVDEIYRFEDIDSEVVRLCRRLRIEPRPLGVARTDSPDRSPYRDYYTDYSREVIDKAFKKDIVTWGYEF
jgi:hypothetical protein